MTTAERDAWRRMPKAERHIHLEGSLTSETLWTLAQRHGDPLGLNNLDACRRVYTFHDFIGFIQAIKTASLLLDTPADYAMAVRQLGDYFRSQGVVYAEVFLSIGILLWRGVAVEPYWEAIEAARHEAERSSGVVIRWVFDAVRQFGPEPFERVVDYALRWHGTGAVVGIGIGGDETRRTALEFAPGYARARARGLMTTIHAGETCGPASVWDALRHLSPGRIGHALHAVEDPRLMDELARRRVVVDVCPTSNVKTGAWPATRPHPAAELYAHGVALAISSDDPGIFGCTLLDEYAWLAEHAGFSFDQLRQLAAASLPTG